MHCLQCWSRPHLALEVRVPLNQVLVACHRFKRTQADPLCLPEISLNICLVDLHVPTSRRSTKQCTARPQRNPMCRHTLHTRTASKKVAVAAHHLHLDTLPILPSHSGKACALGHVNWPQRCLWQIYGSPNGIWYGNFVLSLIISLETLVNVC